MRGRRDEGRALRRPARASRLMTKGWEEWMDGFSPENNSQCFLVRRAADLSFKIEWGDRVEEALRLDYIIEAQMGGEPARMMSRSSPPSYRRRGVSTLRKLA